ncbi:MAG: DMT family transporter [Pseudomonadales bacterium]|jgi:small multidrug resistance pump
MLKTLLPYLILILAVGFGTASNTFANSANGFTKIIPSLLSMITIILCMFCLSQVMKSLPVGITYASFAGICIVATSVVGVVKFNQIPNVPTMVGLFLIIVGVLTVNLLGQTSPASEEKVTEVIE